MLAHHLMARAFDEGMHRRIAMPARGAKRTIERIWSITLLWISPSYYHHCGRLEFVGQNPWPARDALVPQPEQRYRHLAKREQDLWLTKQIRVVLQLTDKKLAELAEVPSVLDVAVSPEQQAILKLIIARQTMARPYVAPPGVPAARLMALRNAFEATMKDPEFLADAKRQGLDVRPVTGAEADALIKQVYTTSPDVV